MTIDLKNHYDAAPDILFQDVSGDMILLDLDKEFYYGLNEVSSRIWNLLKQGKNLVETVDVLLSEYDTDRPTLEQDASQLVENMLEKGILVCR
jgi:hypothetical protein